MKINRSTYKGWTRVHYTNLVDEYFWQTAMVIGNIKIDFIHNHVGISISGIYPEYTLRRTL